MRYTKQYFTEGGKIRAAYKNESPASIYEEIKNLVEESEFDFT